jgi:hypothetical protein
MVRYNVRDNLLLILVLSVGLFAYGSASSAATLHCDQNTAAGMKCTCDLHSLRPLQGAIGMGEVRAKAAKIIEKPDKQRQKLGEDPIKVVRGPDGELFVTDHHHGARAWLEAGYTNGICLIQDEKLSAEPTQFWAQLKERNLVRLADKNGAVIPPDDLPKAIELLPDDPYRTLAYLVRKNDGFCRTLMGQKEFAEFIWADWLRGRVELPASKVAASPEEMLPTALKLTESPAAAGQPGYRGNRPSDYTCPTDADASP